MTARLALTSAPVDALKLSVADQQKHALLGITEEMLAAAQVRRVTDTEARQLLRQQDWSRRESLAGVAYPYQSPRTGVVVRWRVRRDQPSVRDGKATAKYLCSKGSASLYFPPGCEPLLGNGGVPVMFAEAEKSVLAVMCSAGVVGRPTLAIGTGGCWGWRGEAQRDLDLITWRGRSAIIAFDANSTTNPKVQKARVALAAELTNRGAQVRVLDLPIEPNVNGPDDFIGAHGSAAFFALADTASVCHSASGNRVVSLTFANSITPRPVHWLWDGRLALGTLGLIAGREGIGKTTCAYTLVGDLTRGRLPGIYTSEPRTVIIAASEDSWEHTIVPRLMAAEADLSRVARVDVTRSDGSESMLSLPADIDALATLAQQERAAMILLDPLISRLESKLDTHKDADVRIALEPLVRLADVTRTVVLGIIHVNKSGSRDPLNMVMGSRAFTAVARAVLFVAEDPDEEGSRVLGQAKNNLGRCDLPLKSFTIEDTLVGTTAEGEIRTGKLCWTGETDRSIQDVVDAANTPNDTRTAAAEAAEWLKEFIRERNGAAESAVIKREGKTAGHSESALKRARKKLNLAAESAGFPRTTWWLSPGVTLDLCVLAGGEITEPSGRETKVDVQ